MIKRQSTRRRHLVEALRSGEYTQVGGKLEGPSEGFDDEGNVNYGPVGNCCLGVACRVAMKDGLVLDTVVHVDGNTRFSVPDTDNGYNTGSSSSLFPAVMEWYGFDTETGAYGEDGDSLINDNDECGFTFEQIADIIESEPEGLFEA